MIFRKTNKRGHLANSQKMLYNVNVVDTTHEALGMSDFEVNQTTEVINYFAIKN